MANIEGIAELESRHAQALASNQQAKARMKSLVALHGKQKPLKGPSTAWSLKSHLDNLRLQKQYDQLETLSNYFEKVEQIAFDEHIYQGFEVPHQVLPSSNALEDHRNNVALDRLKSLQERAQQLTNNTELVLVQARQRLKHEQSLLLDTQKRVNSHDPDTGVKLAALEATRDELQGWIGTSLAKCEQEQQRLEDSVEDQSYALEPEQDDSIDKEYERYIAMRARLHHAVDELKKPISASPTSRNEKMNLPTGQGLQPPNAKDKARVKMDSYSRDAEASLYPSLPQIHNEHISNYHHEKLLSTWATHLAEQSQSQDSRLLRMLSLLNHESHLLPNHPSPANMAKESGSIAYTHQQIEIDDLLRAWAFASQSADNVLKDAIDIQIADAKTALEGARDHLVGFHALESMKGEVLDKT